MKKLNGQRGITLIALIITIVVLLILAVVTINSIQGDGIIQYASNAADEYTEKSKEEQQSLNSLLTTLESNGNVSKVTEEGVPIPVGFKYVTGTKDTGVVIENETEGSQFVWVPVTKDIVANREEPRVVTVCDFIEDDEGNFDLIEGFDSDPKNLKIINDKLGTTYASSDDFLKALQTEFNLMAESVNKYDGFYIGRYEVSFNSENKAQSKGGAAVQIQSATAAADSANTWYGLYALCKTYNTSSVASSMIWGSQYNAMITWLGSAADTPIEGYNNTKYTGSVETDKINNIYDLYANSLESTLEAKLVDILYYRACYGGPWGRSYMNCPSLESYMYPTDADDTYGSRLALYIV